MPKKRKIDFVLQENDDSKLIFRFYPRKSTCHSFNDIPPTKRDEVYKVYYSYAIFRSYSDDTHVDMLFNCECDECSVIDEVAARIALIVQGKKEYKGIDPYGEGYTIKLLNNEVFPLGYGVTWNISQHRNTESNKAKWYKVEMWDYDNTGFRFTLDREKLNKFGEYLNECCEYMFAHGCPI